MSGNFFRRIRSAFSVFCGDGKKDNSVVCSTSAPELSDPAYTLSTPGVYCSHTRSHEISDDWMFQGYQGRQLLLLCCIFPFCISRVTVSNQQSIELQCKLNKVSSAFSEAVVKHGTYVQSSYFCSVIC